MARKVSRLMEAMLETAEDMRSVHCGQYELSFRKRGAPNAALPGGHDC